VSLPRLLVIMGSGETSPTMVRTHREVFARLGDPPMPAVVLDTPFGFQENASEISARAVEYFRQSVGREVEVAGFRSAAGAGTLVVETMLARLRDARWVFAGPGSPTYALRQWAGSGVPGVLAGKLRNGGCLTFASAAALTLGVATVPVYEIYKVGEDPHWVDGLDLLSEFGLPVAVIPHYDNAEGGTHDTRYCYLGERRLAAIEGDLPGGAFVLGVDEHTGCVLDLGEGTATVVGLGGVTVRRAGRSVRLESGTAVPIARLAELALSAAAAAARPVTGTDPPASGTGPTSAPAPVAASPLLSTVSAREEEFGAALARGDVPGAVTAVLELEGELAGWSHDTLQSDEMDRGRAALRSMVVRLGQLAEAGARDPRAVLGPFVAALLDLRAAARAAGRWAEADAARDRLAALGVEVHDLGEATTWELH